MTGTLAQSWRGGFYEMTRRGAAPRKPRGREHDTHHGAQVPRRPRHGWLTRYGWAGARNAVLFVAGLLGVLHETLAESADRPTLLLLFAAMMGLPAVLGGRK